MQTFSSTVPKFFVVCAIICGLSLTAGCRKPFVETANQPVADSDDGSRPKIQKLSPGKHRRAAFDLRDYTPHDYRFAIDDDVVGFTVEITGAPCTFDIVGQLDEPISDDGLWDHDNNGEENRLTVSRMSETPLESGDYFVRVEYPYDSPPVFAARPLDDISYDISVRFIKSRIDGKLVPGESINSTMSANDGGFRVYSIDVPESATVVRIDLDQTEGDFDLWASRDRAAMSTADAEIIAASLVGRESLILDAASAPPLEAGRWFITVVEYNSWDETSFTLYATLDEKPPKALLEIPPLPTPDDAMKRALFATVELATGNFGGTGVLVSPHGLVLTNHHVVVDSLAVANVRAATPSDAPQLDLITVAATLDVRKPPLELFRARVLDTREDDDLALLQITSGFYGQPLPDQYQFPFVRLGKDAELSIGDPLTVIGFPSIGGLSSRPLVTVTRGIVSGFSGKSLIKSDAAIMGGNSGGAGLSDVGELIGIPTMVVDEGEASSGYLGYLYTVGAVPDEWRQRIEAELP